MAEAQCLEIRYPNSLMISDSVPSEKECLHGKDVMDIGYNAFGYTGTKQGRCCVAVVFPMLPYAPIFG
jgi:hypothetical protein